MDDAIRQKMLELVYGLLERDEADELRRRIADDPQWAAAHAEACRVSQWLAEATRLRVEPLAFGVVEPASSSVPTSAPTEPAARPGEPIPAPETAQISDVEAVAPSDAFEPDAAPGTADGPLGGAPGSSTEPPVFSAPSRVPGQPASPSLSFAAPSPRGKPVAARRKPWTRGANWTVGTAAAVLLLLSLGIYTYHRRQLGAIAEEHLRVVAALPAVVASGAPAQVSVSTSTVTGRPLPAQLELAIHGPDGKRLWVHKEKTTPEGRLAVAMPMNVALSAGARLEVLAARRDRFERLEAPLEVRPAPWLTHVRTDRTVYRPGETVYFRSVTLTPFALSPAQSEFLRFEILDPTARRLGGAVAEGVAESGVGNGAWTIPGDAAAGDYAVYVHGSAGATAGELGARPCRFHVIGEDSPSAPRLVGSAEATTGTAASSRPPVPAPGESAKQDDPRSGEPAAVTQSIGAQSGNTAATESPASGEAPAAASPAARDEWIVRFHPEGGVVAAGLENRVYFTARTQDGKPAALRGFVVDSEGVEWAVVETVHAGRGAFRWTPQPGQRYFLRVVEPPGIDHRYELPAARSDAAIALTTGTGVFAPNEPLEFNLRATKAGIPLVVTADCHGVLVGQQALVTRMDQNGNNPVVIPLDETVAGVVRLTVFDYGGRQPEPIAERLVYRRPARRLSIAITTHADRHEPGAEAEISVSVRAPGGRERAAILGVAVVEDGPRHGFEPPAVPLECGVWLGGGLLAGDEPARCAEALESDDPKALAAIDLLLGTIDARTFGDDPRGGPDSGTPPGAEPTYRVAQATAAPPLVLDNLRDIGAEYEESLARYQSNRTALFQAVTTVIFFGGLALLLLVTMLAVLRMASGSQLWVSAVGAAVCCLVVGTILMTPQRPGVGREGAIAFCPSDAATPAQPAPAADDASDRAARTVAGAERKTLVPSALPEPPSPSGATSGAAARGYGRAAPRGVDGLAGSAPASGAAPRQDGANAAGPAHRQMMAAQLAKAGTDRQAPVERSASGPRSASMPIQQYAYVLSETAGADTEASSDGPPATLFWHPLLATDAEGRATFQVRLPRRAGTFRILVDAHADGGIGSAAAVLRVAPSAGASPAAPVAPGPSSSLSPSSAIRAPGAQ